MKIALLTIASGKQYRGYANQLFDSINLFLPDHELTPLIFSDGHVEVDIPHRFYPILHLPVPLTTLLRFSYFRELDLSEFDLIFYIDADCCIVKPINDEIFPEKGQVVAVQHPWESYNSNIYEINPLSTARVIDNKGMHYFQGCFFGGWRVDFISMIDVLDRNVKIDLKNRIIAKWYDESHLNNYLIQHPPKELDPGYAYPGRDIYQKQNIVPKIIHYNYGGV